MGRRMRPLDPAAGPAERFACELRSLRAMAGELPFWKMARRCAVSKSALAAAAAGHQIPSERVASEFVRACGGEWAAWRHLWVRAVSEAQAAASDSTGHGLVLATPGHLARPAAGWAVINGPPEGGAAVDRRPPAVGRPRFRGRRLPVLTVVAIASAFAVGWALGYHSMRSPAVSAGDAARPLPAILIHDGQDPYVRGCGPDQSPVDRQPIYQADGGFYGWLVLFVSARCSAAWGYVVGPNSPRWTVHIRARRMSDGVVADSSFRGAARPNSWGNALSASTGCVRAEAWINTGPLAVTTCWSPGGDVAHPPPRAARSSAAGGSTMANRAPYALNCESSKR